MLFYDETKLELAALRPQLEELYSALGLDHAVIEIEKLEQQAAEPDFWNDMENSQKVLQKTSRLKAVLHSYQKLENQFEDLLVLIDMAIEEDDETVEQEIKDSYSNFKKELETMKLQTLLKGEYDAKNAILSFHAGAGGTEAQDWVEMLYRMYTRWAERKGFKCKTLDYLSGEEAGIKSVTVLIEGLNAYGFLRSESGVHRLVRISPFDSSGRRHTSFASLEVMPEIDDSVEINIRPEDLKIDTFRSGGAGGQHVNTTDSAVRITHIPTGVVCACQNERSQFQNRDVAMKMLKSKLIEIKEREHLEKIEDIKGDQKDIAWGSQIRSYVFMPYTLVKDHRTNFENGNVNAVMDGDLDGFINAYLKAKSRGEI
ncbi:peptide chain release factor 2 [Paludicola sp. MB14-C6]|uniref:peptide chain release factor 2 n=1 Tax=Paludihabitans sp. MB14-C6 TaxID=3070656 RepID=UPI0027DE49DB|nr:peptide chain release factor 2 [Paludicola sp. MB14-C6]WMJ23237.1 peptide chain release factor 2 [Paludicola sp. MB14-C6]